MMADAIDEITVKLDDYDISKWENEDNESQENSAEVHSEGPPVRKLFVGNISERTTYTQLRKFFKYYGEIVDVHIARDRYSHSKKNYGFVTFINPQDAERVLKLKQEELRFNGRNIHVAPANVCHQPIELPDGSIIWNSKRKSSAEECQSSNGVATLSEKEPATDKEDLGAVGGSPIAAEEQEKLDLVDGECKINILNDDCLLHIFSFLHKTETIRIERVCKRWQSICRDMWVAQKHLDFLFLHPHYHLSLMILEAFMKRCGKNLQSLDLSHKPHSLTARVHRIIANYCRNLRCLNLGGLPLTQAGLQSLGAVSKELRILNLDHCFGVTDKDLQVFFKKCPNLESVSLSQNHALTGKCFHGLSEAPVSQLILDECNNIRTKYLVNGLRALKHLKDLSLNSCSNLTGSDVKVIMTAAPKLNSFSMSRYFPLLCSRALLPLSSLHDLVTLNLQFNPAINDCVIEAITENCKKLEDINLTGCSIQSGYALSITNRGVKCLATLPNLSRLCISYLAHVSDEALQAIAYKGKLQSLICCGCPEFTDVGCISIVTSCNELETFVVSGCDLVSKATLEAALDSVKLRTNGIKLTLVVGGTGAVDCAIERHALLQVDNTDLCVSHLRPGFVDDIYFAAIDNDDEDFGLEFSEDEDIDFLLHEDHYYGFELTGDDMEYLEYFDAD